MDTATDTNPASGQVDLPGGGQVTTPEESPAEKAGALQSWMKTAQPSPPGAPAQPGTVAAPSTPPPTAPVVTSTKRGGLLGVMDSVSDALVGKQRPELGKDAQGNLYIKDHTLTHGEQWMRIAGEAMRGAAAGLAAGRGAGNMGKAAVAGIQAQQQASEDEYNTIQKKVLDNANNQMLRMNLAAAAWKQARLGVEATQSDITFWQGQKDRLEKEGATYLGDTAHAGDISHIRAANPDIMKDLVENHSLEFIPKVGEDGKTAGFAVYKMPEKYGTDMLPAGQEFPKYNNTKDSFDWHKSVKPMTQKEYDDYWTGATNDALDFRTKKHEDALKVAQGGVQRATQANLESETKERDLAAPGKRNLTAAQAAEARATASKAPSEIRKNDAEAAAANAKTEQTKGDSELVDAIGTGHVAADRIGYLLSKNPDLLQQVIKKYPDFDNNKVAGYAQAVKEFNSTKTGTAGAALNQGATALKHLRRLEELNTPMSHVPHTPDWTAYHNQLDTAAPELAKFYGDTTIPAIASLKDTLGSTLPGNRQAAFDTQAVSMSKKFDSYEQQWLNARPSAAYNPEMPNIDPEAQEARAHFDPQYRVRRAQAATGGTVTPPWMPPPGAPPAPAENNKYLYDPQGKPVAKSMGGKWVQP